MQDILQSLTGRAPPSEPLFPPPAAAAASGDRCFLLRRHTNQSLKCPRCDSLNTKFCYYNNYNLSQPRHFCKSCRRYWTKGGVLRNVPVGGGCRKSKPSSSKSSSSKHLYSPSLYVDKSQPRDDAALTNINNSTDDISTIAVSASPVIPTDIPMLFHEYGASCMEKQATTTTTASSLYGIEEMTMNDDNDNMRMLTEMGNYPSMIGSTVEMGSYGYGGVVSEKEGFGALDWEGEGNGGDNRGEELKLFVDHAYWSEQNNWDDVVVDHHHHQTRKQVRMNEWQWW